VAGAGDVDGDGVPDLIVGAPFTSGGQLSRSGRATLYSGRTGGVIRLYEGEESGANLGLAVAGVGDVDGDGYDDVAITVPGDSGRGSVRVHSGRTGGRMFLFFGSSGSYLGQSVAAAGDVNRDGFADVIVGAPVEDAAYVLSGRTGQLLRRLQGTDAFGASVCGVGDVNADGFPDLAVGSPNGGPGRVELFSGQTFGLLRRVYEWQPGEGFGSSLAGGGDVNGDGVPDVAVGMPAADPWGTNSGRTAILSGLDGTTLFSFMGSGSGMELGCSVALIRDVNDDGRADLLMGTRGTDAAQLFLTSGKTIGRSNLFGRPGATSGGLLPRAGVGGSPQIGTTVSLALRAAPPASLALMLLGFLRADVDLGPSGAPGNRLYTFPTLILTTGTGIDGRAALPIALPDEPGLVGVGCFLQWGVIDPPANALGVVSSDAARIVIGRL
jgi:hypothetical protein